MKRKGFTLIEVMLALGITTLVLGAIYTFFFTSNKTLATIDINGTLQTEGEKIQNELVFVGTQATGILKVDNINLEDSYNNYLNSQKKLEISSELSFAVEDDRDKFIYTFLVEGNKLSLKEQIVGDSNATTKELSKNVQSFTIRPIDVNINVNGSLKTAPGLEITIVLNKEKGYSEVSYPISTIVKFRNK